MGRLGDFLEAVYGPQSTYSTVRATIRQWCNKELEGLAGSAKSRIGRRKRDSSGPNAAPSIEDSVIETLISMPSCFRIEKRTQTAGKSSNTLIIANGEREWIQRNSGPVEVRNANRKSDTDVARHFDQSSLREYFVALALESVGDVVTAGRNCVKLRAVPRPKEQLWPHWLPHGADEYEFHADVERGVLLYIAGRYENEVFEVNEVTNVVFDERLDEALFSHAAASDERVRPAAPTTEHLTLSAARTRVPFTILVPQWLPDGADAPLEVIYHAPDQSSPEPSIALFYRGNFSLWFNESASADPEDEEMEWDPVEYDGIKMSVSDPNDPSGQKLLRLERGGTHVTIMSNFALEQIIKVAASLAPQ